MLPPSNTYDPAAYRYGTDVINAISGTGAAPQTAQRAHWLPPSPAGSGGRCGDALPLPHPPRSQAQMRQVGSAQIRSRQGDGRLPPPGLEPPSAGGAAAMLEYALKWFSFQGFAHASPVAAETCQAPGQCHAYPATENPKPAPSKPTAKQKTHTSSQASNAQAQGASVFALLDLVRDEPALQVTLSPALKQAGAHLAGSWILVAWDVLPPSLHTKLKRLAGPDDGLLFAPMLRAEPQHLRGKGMETLPLHPDHKKAREGLQVIPELHAFLRKLDPQAAPEPNRMASGDQIMMQIEAGIIRIGRKNLSTAARAELDARVSAAKAAMSAWTTFNGAQANQDLSNLQQRMAKPLESGFRMVFCDATLVEKLAPAHLRDGRIAVLSPPDISLSSGLPGGYRRTLNHLRSLAGPDYEIELSPQLRDKKEVRLDGLLIVWPDYSHHDLEAHRRRDALMARVFDATRDHLLVERAHGKAVNCKNGWGVPAHSCTGIDDPVAVALFEVLLAQLQTVIDNVVGQIRARNPESLPDERALRLMGTDAAIVKIKSSLASDKSGLHPNKDVWLDQLKQANSRLLEKMTELNPQRESFALNKLIEYFRPNGANHLDQGEGHLANLRTHYFSRYPTVIMHDVRAREDIRKFVAQAMEAERRG